MSGIAPSVGIEWFVDDQQPDHLADSNDAKAGITSANDALFLRTHANDVPIESGRVSAEEMIQKGLAYDRISLKVRNGTKKLLSTDARKARSNLVSMLDPSACAPKWLK
jgi:hypothetical protein